MKSKRLLATILFVAFSVTCLSAQPKPSLTQIKFLINGLPVDTTSYEDIRVELLFSEEMDETVSPSVKFGLNAPYTLTVAEGLGWINSQTWQGLFTISDAVPNTGDGLYTFQVANAKNLSGTVMDTTLSSQLGATLYICRSGHLQLSTNSLDFESIKVGDSRTLSFTVENTSCADLTITNLTLPTGFALTGSVALQTIPGGQERTYSVRFFPNERRAYTGNVTIQSNDRTQSIHSIQLNGSAHGPQIRVISATPLAFGKVEVDSIQALKFKIANLPASDINLSDTLHVASIITTGNGFSASPEQLKIAPDDTQEVTVTFSPAQHRTYSEVLRINSDDSFSSVVQIGLTGNASDETPPPPITSIRATWGSGFAGYTSGIYLPICWDNPSDPSGIAQIWWKFTRSSAPPTSATDTTSAGGRIILDSGAACASLRLFGRLTSGYWYCYVWLVDGNGNSGWANATATAFTYDITPPPAPEISNRSILPWIWFSRFTPFRITLEMPFDPVRNIRDASEVRWKFKSAPTSGSSYNGRIIFDNANGESREITIPFESPELCGDDSLYIWLVDSAGNANLENLAIARYRFDICPPEIRRLKADSANVASLATAFTDTVEIIDNVGVDTAWVRYRFGGAEAEEPPRAITRIGETDNFLVEIPSAGVTKRGIEYTVVASDSLDNRSRGPETETSCSDDSVWFSVRTQTSGEGDFRVDSDGRPVPLLDGDQAASYQLFSVPYVLEKNALMDVMSDDLGAYDSTMWRVFDYKADNDAQNRFLEGSDARPFVPGRSFFVITRQEDIVVDSGPGITRRTVCPDSIELKEGWNLIATPFNFPVNKESLSLRNSNSVITLRSYERGWNIVDVMDPWKGYALFITTENREQPVYLVVQPKAAPGRISKTESAPFAGDGYQIRISARSGQLHDLDNWAGIAASAKEGYDHLELAEPPVVGDYLKVAFPHADWSVPAAEFSTDLRPADSDNQEWEFEVATNLPKAAVTLEFDIEGELPAGASVYLIDDGYRVSQDLLTAKSYDFISGETGSIRKLRLLVGTTEYVAEQSGGIGLAPEAFELLQNFPNPFNPETVIRYNLPQTSFVKLQIFDLLGREVRTLLNSPSQPAGFQAVVWDGRDNTGGSVPSGVYIYRLRTQAGSVARKMVLVK